MNNTKKMDVLMEVSEMTIRSSLTDDFKHVWISNSCWVAFTFDLIPVL